MPEIDAKFLSQYGAVRLAALEEGIHLDKADILSSNRQTPAFVYEKDHVLVRDEEEEDLLGRHLDADRVDGRGAPGVGLYRIGEPVLEAVDRLSRISSLRTGIATPNHLVSICPVQLCPADEPVPLPVDASQAPYPALVPGIGGHGVRVEVIDTGLVPGFEIGHDWLAGGVNGVPASVTGVPKDPFGPAGAIKEYAGHGTFVTGVLRCAAPSATVNVSRTLHFAGATMEDKFALSLHAALDRSPDIISLSAGGPTLGGHPHAALEPFFARLTSEGVRTLLVAAAGNDGNQKKFYPAAYAPESSDAIVSVGALRADGKGRACFSNYGDWVNVFALGERHINAFMSGGYSYVDPQRPDLTCRFYPDNRLYCTCTCVTMPPQGAVVSFRGMAQWSGTSFATPLVAGLIASHLSDNRHLDAREAAKEVLKRATTIKDNGVPIYALPDGIKSRSA